MSDGQSEGSRHSFEERTYAAYLQELLKFLESGASLRRFRQSRPLRKAATAVDDALGTLRGYGVADNLADTVSRLRAEDRIAWHRLLMRTYGCGHRELYDRLLAISPFRGTLLLFVEHWRSGTLVLSGPFTEAVAKRLTEYRKHDDAYREQFLLALADLGEIEPDQVSRLPRGS